MLAPIRVRSTGLKDSQGENVSGKRVGSPALENLQPEILATERVRFTGLKDAQGENVRGKGVHRPGFANLQSDMLVRQQNVFLEVGSTSRVRMSLR